MKTQVKPSLPLAIFKDNKHVYSHSCAICKRVPNPKLAFEHLDCGRLFCQNCSETILKPRNICPICKQHIKKRLRNIEKKNKTRFTKLYVMRFKCPTTLEHSTCSWIGIWSLLEEHLADCKWATNIIKPYAPQPLQYGMPGPYVQMAHPPMSYSHSIPPANMPVYRAPPQPVTQQPAPTQADPKPTGVIQKNPNEMSD